jgi:hypothetical protein
MVDTATQGRSLEQARVGLERWRRAHGGRGRPIPAALWSEAAEVARTHGVEATARALGVRPAKLARLVGEARTEGEGGRPRAESTKFVALDGLRLDAGGERGTVVELVGRDGERVRVEVVGDASGVDITALARAFWSRGA